MDVLANGEPSETRKSAQFIPFLVCVYLMSALDHSPCLRSAPDTFPRYRFDIMLFNLRVLTT